MQARLCLLLVLIAGIPSIALAQAQTQKQQTATFSDGGADNIGAGPMESIFIPPKAGAPFDLKLAAEWSRPLPTGGTFALANERRIARDSRGRIYQERWVLVPKGGDIKSQMTVFQITDPDQHTWYNCSPHSRICDLRSYSLTSNIVFKPSLGTSGPLSDGRGYRQVDDLGEDTIQALDTHGYRETTTINPGIMGNDAPMIATREFWFSPQLGINLRSLLDNPQTGKQVFLAREVSTSEPDPALFEVPGDYRIVDRRADAHNGGPKSANP